MMCPFPIAKKKNDEMPDDGYFFNLPVFCKQIFNNKCSTFYTQISSIKGYHTCPYGMAAFVTEINNENFIVTGVNIKGYSIRKEILKHESKNESIPLFTRNSFESVIQKFSLFSSSYIMEKNQNRENQAIIKKASFESKLITNTLHEMRKLNKQIKIQSEYLRNEIDAIKCKAEHCDKDSLGDRSFNIFSTSQLITTRLNAYDFTVNPSLADSAPKVTVTVFKKFEKAKHCLELSAKDKQVKILLTGRSVLEMNCFKMFELLPFIILENAVKYSPKGKDIQCIFNKNNTVEIRNFGPKPIESDLNVLFHKEKRSKVVQKYEGTGLGLYLAKVICEYHNIDINISLGSNSEIIDSVEHADFIVELNLNPTKKREQNLEVKESIEQILISEENMTEE